MYRNIDEQDISKYSKIPKIYAHLKDKKFDDWEIPPWELCIDLSKKIGEGTWANVYLAKWRQTIVVAKVLKNISDLEAKQLIIKEFQYMTKMHHPNIVQLFGYVEEPFVIVMEYFQNGDLLENLLKLTLSQKIKIAKDILQGLTYIHERKPHALIHRDIKLRNILLTNSYTAKISDFGLSTFSINNIIKSYSGNDLVNLINNTNQNKRENLITCDTKDLTDNVGTKRYMAPEIKTGNYNTKVDIYSCGILFHELFTNTRYEYFVNIYAPNNLNILILKMINPNPDLRPTSTIAIKEFNNIKFKKDTIIQQLKSLKLNLINGKTKIVIRKVKK